MVVFLRFVLPAIIVLAVCLAIAVAAANSTEGFVSTALAAAFVGVAFGIYGAHMFAPEIDNPRPLGVAIALLAAAVVLAPTVIS